MKVFLPALILSMLSSSAFATTTMSSCSVQKIKTMAEHVEYVLNCIEREKFTVHSASALLLSSLNAAKSTNKTVDIEVLEYNDTGSLESVSTR